jgi:hypothetical protein
VHQRERGEHENRPEGGDLALVVLPGMRRHEGSERDRQEDSEERQRPGEAELRAVELRGERSVRGEEGGERQERPSGNSGYGSRATAPR